MKPKETVRSIFPEAYLERLDSYLLPAYYAIFVHKTPKGAKGYYYVMLGTNARSPRGAWYNAMKEINERMMGKLES